MKHITKSLIIVLFFNAGCHKESGLNVNSEVLTGTWKLTESLTDPGNGSGKWVPLSISATYVQFSTNGDLGGNVFSDYTSYILKDSVTITFSKKDKTMQNYMYHIKNGVLEMSPAGPIFCTEGCGIRFIKVED